MQKEKRILFLGDSLIEFFDWQKCFRNVQVLNRGRAGETVNELLMRVPSEVAAVGDMDMIIIMIGANNLAMEDYSFLRDYEKLLFKLRQAFPAAHIGACSLLPFQFPWLAADAVKRLNDVLRSLSENAKVDYLDVYAGFIAAGEAEQICFQADGVHLTEKGYGRWIEVLREYFTVL